MIDGHLDHEVVILLLDTEANRQILREASVRSWPIAAVSRRSPFWDRRHPQDALSRLACSQASQVAASGHPDRHLLLAGGLGAPAQDNQLSI